MANSVTNLNTITPEQVGKEITMNAFMDASSQAALFGRDYASTTDLVWGYLGGNFTLDDASVLFVSNGTVNLTDNTTNYLLVNKTTGTVVSSTSILTNYIKLYTINTTGGAVVSYTDNRAFKLFDNTDTDVYTNVTLTSVTAGAIYTLSASQAAAKTIILSGTNAGSISILLPARAKNYFVYNSTSVATTFRTTTATTTVSVANATGKYLFSDGVATVYGTT